MEELCEVLSDPRWAAERLTRAEGMGLQEDFKIYTGLDREEGEGCEAGDTVWSLRKIAREARLSASYVARNSREVWFQLYDRLLIFKNKSELIRKYLCTIEKVAERPWLKSLTPQPKASDAVQDIFAHQGHIVGMSGCAEKNEMTAWERNGDHLFRRTFQNGEVKKNVICEVSEDVRVVWSLDGMYVAVVRSQRNVQVWDMHTGATAQRVGLQFSLGNENYDVYVWNWNLTGDGKRLAHSDWHCRVSLWDVDTGVKTKEVMCAWGSGEVSFSPDGKRFLCAQKCGIFSMVCEETGKTMSRYPLVDGWWYDDAHFLYSWNFSFWWSRNGKWVGCKAMGWMAGTPVHRLLISNGETGEIVRDEEIPPTASLVGLWWSEDEKRLWFIRDGELCVWDGGSGKIIKKVKVNAGESCPEEFESCEMSLTTDERWVALSEVSIEWSVTYVWVMDAETGAVVWSDEEQHLGFLSALGWLQNGRQMFSADPSGKIVVWGWDNLETVKVEKASEEEDQRTTAVTCSSDDACGDNERVLCLANENFGMVATWNSKTGEKLWRFRKDRLCGCYGVYCNCWSNNGARVLVYRSRHITLRTGKNGDKLRERVLPRPPSMPWDNDIHSVAWSGNDTKIAFWDSGGRIVVRSSRTGDLVGHAIELDGGYGSLIKWSPNEKWIASSGSGSKIVIWNWETGAIIWSLEESHVSCLEWSGDGRHVAYGRNGKLVIWSFETGQTITEEETGQRISTTKQTQELVIMNWWTGTSTTDESMRHIVWAQDGSRVAMWHENWKLRILEVRSQGIVCVKRYDGAACFDKSSLRQLIDTKEGQLSAELERKLKIRQRADEVLYTAGDEEICLATTVAAAYGNWCWSTSCRYIAIREDRDKACDERKNGIHFYELVE